MKPEECRSKRSLTEWAIWGLCLASLGCQVDGTDTTPRAQWQPETVTGNLVALAASSEQPAETEVFRAVYKQAETEPLPSASHHENPGKPIPTEVRKRAHPANVIEPPDVLRIGTIHLVLRQPYTIGPMEVLHIHVPEALPNQPIDGLFTVAPDGTINLGYNYGFVHVADLTLPKVAARIQRTLARSLRDPRVAVQIVKLRVMQEVHGDHPVNADGTVNLGSYGSVYVTGMTAPQAKLALERHLAKFLLHPVITLETVCSRSTAN